MHIAVARYLGIEPDRAAGGPSRDDTGDILDLLAGTEPLDKPKPAE